MPTLEQQLHLSVVAVNLNTTILKLRKLAEEADVVERRILYRNAAYKLENLLFDLGLK